MTTAIIIAVIAGIVWATIGFIITQKTDGQDLADIVVNVLGIVFWPLMVAAEVIYQRYRAATKRQREELMATWIAAGRPDGGMNLQQAKEWRKQHRSGARVATKDLLPSLEEEEKTPTA